MKIFDTHIHCIPGIDDGAQSFKEAIQMIEYGLDHGIGAYICTPHSECIFEENKSEEVNGREMLAGKVPAKLFPGCEVRCYKHNLESVIEKIRNGTYYSLGGNSPYYLIEFDYYEKASNIVGICKLLLESNIQPVVAHAERCIHIMDAVSELKNIGCKIQINVSSVTDDAFICNPKTAISLVVNHYVDFLGTDAHRMNWRVPTAKEGLNVIHSLLPEDEVRDIAYRNALKYLITDHSGTYISEEDFK